MACCLAVKQRQNNQVAEHEHAWSHTLAHGTHSGDANNKQYKATL